MVAGPGGLAFIDFDRATIGPPEADLGSLAAAALVDQTHQAGKIATEVQLGYAEAREGPDPVALATHTAAHLLRRAAEPFRSCWPDWPAGVARILDQAGAVLDDPTAAPLGGRDARP